MENGLLPQEPLGEVINALHNGSTYVRDLTDAQQYELYATMHAEVQIARYFGTGELGGIATQAYLGSIIKAVNFGASKMVRRYDQNEPIGLVNHDDCVQSFFANVSIDWHLQQYQGQRTVGAKIIGRAFSQAHREFMDNGGYNVTYPGSLQHLNAAAKIQQLHIVKPGHLNYLDYTTALSESGSASYHTESVDAAKIAIRIEQFYTSQPVLTEQYTDDDAWQVRCDADSDMCDDEWVGASNEVAVWDVYSGIEGNDTRDIIAKLPWGNLTPKQKHALQRRFGFNGDGPLTTLQIAHEDGCKVSTVNYLIRNGIKALQSVEPIKRRANSDAIPHDPRITNEQIVNNVLCHLPIEKWTQRRLRELFLQGRICSYSTIRKRFGSLKDFKAAGKLAQDQATTSGLGR